MFKSKSTDSGNAKEDGKAMEEAVVAMPPVIKSMSKGLIFILVSSGASPSSPPTPPPQPHPPPLLSHTPPPPQLPPPSILLLSSSCMECLDWPFEDEGLLAHSLICPKESLLPARLRPPVYSPLGSIKTPSGLIKPPRAGGVIISQYLS